MTGKRRKGHLRQAPKGSGRPSLGQVGMLRPAGIIRRTARFIQMEITEDQFQELLKSGEYPIAVDFMDGTGGRRQVYAAPKPTRAGQIVVDESPDGSRSVRLYDDQI